MSQEEKVKNKSLNILNQNVEEPASVGPQVSRRRFLQILGTASAAGVVGCADKATQNVFPNVKGDTQQIPGVSVWYSSTCGECSAGCGIKVRTREGRAVKIEGNVDHPVNGGGICALGQSSLQALYDPDRVRQPLKKSGSTFEPISWEEALTQLGGWLKDAKKKALFTSEISGALQELVDDFSKAHGTDHVAWDLLQPTALAEASQASFGTEGIPQYKIEKADTLINFGADFLETWVSPCEYARGWAKARKNKRPIRVVQIEPRLSLTGANADLWLSPKPGTEALLAGVVLKMLLDFGHGSEYKASLSKLVSGLDAAVVSQKTGISLDKISLIAQYLHSSSSSLVLAGGTSASGSNAYELSVICNMINLVLGNVGKTVIPSQTRAVQTSVEKIKALVDSLGKGEVDLLMVYDANPVFTLPASYGFKYAAKKAGHIVSFSSHLDETAELADLILPSHTYLESWGDQRSVTGIYSLQQPVMTPLFDTKAFADSLLDISERAGKPIASASGKDFQSYLKDSWKKLHTRLGTPETSDFKTFWETSLEKGGYFAAVKNDTAKYSPSAKAFEVSVKPIQLEKKHDAHEDIIVYPYPSVKSFDGRAANRPWMQELPDPITQVAWDSWAEVNPKTAKDKGLAQGDVVTVRNFYGEINVPVYVTKHIAEGIIAVPIGQGHTSYGRFAKKVGGGNVLDLLAASKDNVGVNLYGTTVEILRAPGKANLVTVQEVDSQFGRGLAQTEMVTAASFAESDHHDDHHGDHHDDHHGHHEPKQMYKQREHPLYKWGMAVDLATCTGCAACVVACYAENNIPVVGKARMSEGREMSWLRIERYYEGEAEELKVSFLPMMCQHCNNAPCEPVCPVYATYHNEEGLNAMVYNRCVGTRYCSNNCSYKVRRFNWFEYELPSPMELQLNPDVMKRVVGVMEKCTFCVQRIAEAKDVAKDLGRQVQDGEIKPACVQSCSTDALVFGNLNDPESKVSKLAKDQRAYKVLDHHLNTQPAISYLKNIKYEI